MVEIPLHNLPAFSQRIKLDDREYEFEFQWLSRLGYFVFNVFDNEQQPIALGVKLQKEWPLMRRYPNFTGELLFTGEGKPNPQNLKTFELVYVAQ